MLISFLAGWTALWAIGVPGMKAALWAGVLQAVVEAGFQFKNGAAFMRDGCYTDFDFRDKHSKGWGTTYQVQRAHFDHILAKEAERFGAEVRYRNRERSARPAQSPAAWSGRTPARPQYGSGPAGQTTRWYWQPTCPPPATACGRAGPDVPA